MSKIIRYSIFATIFILLITIGFGTITCNVKDINVDNTKIFCFYKSTVSGNFDIKTETSKDLKISVQTTESKFVANATYSITIDIDVTNSKQGEHYIILKQNADVKKIYFTVTKISNDLNYNVNYGKTYAEITLSIPNSDTRNKIAIVKVLETKGYNIQPTEIRTTLLKNTINKVKFKAYYVVPETTTLKFQINTSDKDSTINVPIFKQNISFDQSKLTPLFALTTSSKTIVILDVILFMIAVVLFTMFIGRLGKILVKEN